MTMQWYGHPDNAVVNMTMNVPPLGELTALLRGLSLDVHAERRHAQLLSLISAMLPCDAVALLRHEGDGSFRVVAMEGLSEEVRGRRFRLEEQPRLQAIWHARGVKRFRADSPLPDPYDGLLVDRGAPLVHDCLGAVLRIEGHPWGLLTVDALQAGRFEETDVDTLELVVALCEAVVAAGETIGKLRREAHRALQLQADKRSDGGMVGESEAMRLLRQGIAAVADSDLAVLVSGETGTGKELVVGELHRRSLRADGPLVTVNAAALPDHLVESELFGHRQGAFTGATDTRRGRFQLAHGGTLFLDEVGELPLVAQAKLLRVLQSGDVRPVGSDEVVRVDVRVVAATNRDLQEEVRRGRFRADLYHRLAVFPLRVPPLRERGRDVVLLAGHFAEIHRARLGLRSLRLHPEVWDLLLAYDWPGNVRELEHLIGRAAVRARHHDPDASVTTVTARFLDIASEGAGSGERGRPSFERSRDPAQPTGSRVRGVSLRDSVDSYKAELIRQAVEEEGSWAAAARALDVDPANLLRMARRLGIR